MATAKQAEGQTFTFVLTDVINMRHVPDYAARGAHIRVFAMSDGGPAAEVYVIESKDLPTARQSVGAVRHVAFPGRNAMPCLGARFFELRIRNPGAIDCFYFRSLYFREPNGILFDPHRRTGFCAGRADGGAGRETGAVAVSGSTAGGVREGLKPIG